MTPNTPTSGRLLVDAREASRLLSISTRTLWTLTACGAIPCIRIGRLVRYQLSALERFAAAGGDKVEGPTDE